MINNIIHTWITFQKTYTLFNLNITVFEPKQSADLYQSNVMIIATNSIGFKILYIVKHF